MYTTAHANKNAISLLPPEQQICIACGFCCDGTLFAEAILQAGEGEYLPGKILKQCFTTKKGTFFRLPCTFFKKKCSIYYMPKAQICSTFRCRLLTDIETQKIIPADAHKIIENVRLQLEEIYLLTHQVLNLSEKISLTEIHKKLKNMESDESETPQLKILIARCTILEALLIRHFKPDSEFAEMKYTAASFSCDI